MSLKEILIIVIIFILITLKFKKEYFTENITCNKKIDNLKKLKYFQNKNNQKLEFKKDNTIITDDSNPNLINKRVTNRWFDAANININLTNKPCNNKKIELEEIYDYNSKSKNCPESISTLNELCKKSNDSIKYYDKFDFENK